MTHDGPAQPFDEDAALAELERLRQAIMAARRERKQKSDEFDAFVQSFRNPARTPPVERPAPPAPTVERPQQLSRPSVIEKPPADPLTAGPLPAEDIAATNETTAPATPPPVVRSRPRVRWPIAIGATVGVIALSVLATRSRREPPPAESVNPVPDNRVAPEPAETPAPAAPEPAAPVQEPTRAVNLELRTLQSVWMRVVIDGEKKTEGMVPAGQSLHFGGDDSIVVRVGNGGAVLVKSGDREAPFGVVAQPLTRRFSKP